MFSVPLASNRLKRPTPNPRYPPSQQILHPYPKTTINSCVCSLKELVHEHHSLASCRPPTDPVSGSEGVSHLSDRERLCVLGGEQHPSQRRRSHRWVPPPPPAFLSQIMRVGRRDGQSKQLRLGVSCPNVLNMLQSSCKGFVSIELRLKELTTLLSRLGFNSPVRGQGGVREE